MRVLILGSTGQTGQEVCRALIRQGLCPIAAARNLDKAHQLFGKKADYQFFDFRQPESYSPALKYVDRVFAFAPPNSEDPEPMRLLLKAMRKAQVQRLVFQSGRATGDVPGSLLFQLEQLLAAPPVPSIILRPGWLMQNFLSWAGATLPEKKLMLPAGNAPCAFVDARDLGDAIAYLLTVEQSDFLGKTLECTSLEALTHIQIAEALSRVTETEITYQDLSPDAYVQLMIKRGWPEGKAQFTAWLYRFVRKGKESQPSPTLSRLLGHPPNSFRTFVTDYRPQFEALLSNSQNL